MAQSDLGKFAIIPSIFRVRDPGGAPLSGLSGQESDEVPV